LNSLFVKPACIGWAYICPLQGQRISEFKSDATIPSVATIRALTPPDGPGAMRFERLHVLGPRMTLTAGVFPGWRSSVNAPRPCARACAPRRGVFSLTRKALFTIPRMRPPSTRIRPPAMGPASYRPRSSQETREAPARHVVTQLSHAAPGTGLKEFGSRGTARSARFPTQPRPRSRKAAPFPCRNQPTAAAPRRAEQVASHAETRRHPG